MNKEQKEKLRKAEHACTLISTHILLYDLTEKEEDNRRPVRDEAAKRIFKTLRKQGIIKI